jgi:hypothetical protein
MTDDDFKKLEKRIETLEKNLNAQGNAGSVLGLLLLLLVIYCGLPWWAAVVLVVIAVVRIYQGRKPNERK